MRVMHFAALVLTTALVIGCAFDSKTARSVPPTTYVNMTEPNPFDVTHHDRPDGWTELLLRKTKDRPSEPDDRDDMSRA